MIFLGSQRRWVALLSLALHLCVELAEAMRECPEEPSIAPRSKRPDDVQIPVSFTNKAGADLDLFWCDSDGNEIQIGSMSDGERLHQESYAGQVFHVRSQAKRLVGSYTVKPPKELNPVIKPCVGMNKRPEDDLDKSRWPEFERLAAAAETPCEGSSSQWSCARVVSDAEVKARDPALYGFNAEEVEISANPYKAHTTADHLHMPQMRYMPNSTDYEGGYLRMQMTDTLKKLLPFYESKRNATFKAVFIPGYFTNNHIIHMDMVSIDYKLKMEVQDEMKQVLEWWTKTRLKHTTTFGIRVYRREAMLINHLDRKDTHHVSAILQVHQVCDEDGGWPLEVIHPHREGLTEVYLQPGEMMLYEGARIPHGRPMRFRGEEFANVFSHFVPADFRGPNERWRNPHLDQNKKTKRTEL